MPRFYVAVLALLLALPALAQFRETVEVRLLEVEATVLDKQGKPIDDLTRDDFAITLNGQRTSITNFALISQKSKTQVPTRLIFVVDDLHLHPATKQHALEGVHRFITNSMTPQTTASLVTWNGTLQTRVNPTSRRDLLLRELVNVAREAPRGMATESERRAAVRLCQSARTMCAQTILQFAESQAEDTDRTIRALRDVLDSVAGYDGRKLLIFLSEGMPTLAGVELFAAAADMRGISVHALKLNKTRDIRNLAKSAQNAGVIFSMLDPSLSLGVASGMDDYRVDRQQIRDFARESGRILARETGGKLVADENDLHRALTTIQEQVSTYYSIGVHTPGAVDEVKVEVEVNRPNARVLTATRRRIPSQFEAIANGVRSHLYLKQEENPLDARLSVELQKTERCTAMLQLLVPKEKLTLSTSGAIRGQIDVRLAVIDGRDFESDVLSASVLVTDRHGATIGQGIPVILGNGGQYAISVAVTDSSSGLTSYLQRDVDCNATAP